jgi:hypothetical protein
MVSGLVLGIIGLILLTRLGADSEHLTGLLPPMVCLGAGLGLLTVSLVGRSAE